MAGTVGALFGTPAAAALLFTGVAGAMAGPGALFDKLFLPLVSAGAGAAVMTMLGGTLLTVSIPAASGAAGGWDVLAALAIAPLAAGFGLAGVSLSAGRTGSSTSCGIPSCSPPWAGYCWACWVSWADPSRCSRVLNSQRSCCTATASPLPRWSSSLP